MGRKTRVADPIKPEEEGDLVEQDFTIVRVRAVKTGEHPSGVLRPAGDEFDFVMPEGSEKLPHWLVDVEGQVESRLSPQETNES